MALKIKLLQVSKGIMMENLFLITLIVIVFWIVGFVVYIVISNRQVNLEDQSEKN